MALKDPEKERVYRRAYRARNRERVRANQRAWYARNAARACRDQQVRGLQRKQFLCARHGGRCQRCGEDDIRVLEFHHRNPKTKRGAVSELPIVEAFKEARKCALLCANCHRRAEYELHTL